MAHYYCYLLDRSGHVKAREILLAITDDDAIEQATRFLQDHPSIPGVEVWLEKRRVEQLEQSAPATLDSPTDSTAFTQTGD
jgi:hypothetical protein